MNNATSILARLGYSDTLEVPAIGLRGGLVFAWRRGFEFNLVVMNQFIFSLIIFGAPNYQSWELTFVHGPCDWNLKASFWEKVNSIGNAFKGPWLILGDFNAVSGQYEKHGGRPVAS